MAIYELWEVTLYYTLWATGNNYVNKVAVETITFIDSIFTAIFNFLCNNFYSKVHVSSN